MICGNPLPGGAGGRLSIQGIMCSCCELLAELDELSILLSESKDINKDVQSGTIQAGLDLEAGAGRIKVPHAGRLEYRAKAAALKSRYSAQLWGAIDKAAKGAKSAAVFRKEAIEIIEEFFQKAWTLGRMTVGLGKEMGKLELKAVSGAAREEFAFAKKFMEDVRDGTGKMPSDKRLQMYADTLDSMYMRGVVYGLPSDVEIWWVLGIAEHCPDCIELSLGSPYSKPGYGDNPLPAVPGSGYTQCLSHCKCTLEMQHQGENLSPEPQIAYDAEKNGVDWAEWPKAERDAIKTEMDMANRLFGQMAYYRQMMEATRDNPVLRREYIAARKRVNQEIIELQRKMGVRLVPRASVQDIIAPVTEARRANLILATRFPERVKSGDKIRILNGLSTTQGKVTDINRGNGGVLHYSVKENIKKSVRLDDSDQTIVWIDRKEVVK